MERIDYKGFTIRPGTLDDYIVNEISSYRTLEITPQDTVLDIGANIGTFSSTALSKGASQVIAVEPDPENFELLQINAPEALHINAAVIPALDPRVKVPLYKNWGKNKGLHSTVPTRGRQSIDVFVVSWEYLMQIYRPTKVKIDCEGAEYTFLKVDKLISTIKGLIIEYNLTRRGEREAAVHLHTDFLENKWECVRTPTFSTKAWATIASYRR